MRKNGEPKRRKADPGIPNLWPFKEELLQQIERAKIKKGEEAAEAKRAKELLKEQRRKQTLEEMVRARREADAKHRQEEEEDDDAENLGDGRGDGSRRAFLGELRKVVEASDVLLEVLDARDPIGSRCTGVERFVSGKYPEKKIVLVLNKIDLVPREAVEQWLKHLRNELPTVAFKCSTQQQRTHLAHAGHGAPAQDAAQHLLQSSECLGSDTLLQLLKNYARSADMKTSVTVGVVGLPNVGKSSLINSLKRARVVNVGATPGVTRAMQEVHLDKHVKLLDAPGVVLGRAGADPLRNAVKVEQLADPIAPVDSLLQRCQREQLMLLYRIPTFVSTQEFLFHVARAKGKLRKGGVPDAEAAARIVLQDWNAGRISYYTLPPALPAGVHVSASIVPAFTDDAPLLARLSATAPGGALLMSAPAATNDTDLAEALAQEEEDDEDGDDEDAEEDQDMEDVGGEEEEEEEEEEDYAAPQPPRLQRKVPSAAPRVEKLLRNEEQVNPQTNRKRREEAKAAKRRAKRAPKKDADEEDSLSDVSESDDSSE